MTWCCCEALMDMHREQLCRCVVGCLLRDERRGRLHVRFRGARDDLERVSFYLGTYITNDQTAIAINEATSAVATTFCTSRSLPPTGATCETHLDRELLDKLTSIVEACTVDAASNEVTGVRDMSAANPTLDTAAAFPNCKFIFRDAAHASRRVLQRPWDADPVTEQLIGMVVVWKNSLGRLMHHSDQFRDWYREACEAHPGSTMSRFGNLRCAAHRFETYVTPLSRICLNLSAFFISLCAWPRVAAIHRLVKLPRCSSIQ